MHWVMHCVTWHFFWHKREFGWNNQKVALILTYQSRVQKTVWQISNSVSLFKFSYLCLHTCQIKKKATKDYFLKAVKQFFVLWIGRLKFLTSPPLFHPSSVSLTSLLFSIPRLYPHLPPIFHPLSSPSPFCLSYIPCLYPSPPSSLPSLICIPHLPPLFHPSSVSLTSLLSSILICIPHLPALFHPSSVSSPPTYLLYLVNF